MKKKEEDEMIDTALGGNIKRDLVAIFILSLVLSIGIVIGLYTILV